jgi:hypothetical protein
MNLYTNWSSNYGFEKRNLLESFKKIKKSAAVGDREGEGCGRAARGEPEQLHHPHWAGRGGAGPHHCSTHHHPQLPALPQAQEKQQ